jgi:hypothetical protein
MERVSFENGLKHKTVQQCKATDKLMQNMEFARHPFVRCVWFFIAAVLLPAAVHGQTWRSSLYPENWQRPGE